MTQTTKSSKKPLENSDHAIYIAVFEINKYSKTESEMIIKTFSDDLQSALKAHSSSYKDYGLNMFYEKNLKIGEAYFNSVLTFHQSTKELISLEYLSHRIEGDAHFIRFKLYSAIEEIEKANISYLMELFPSQQNIILLQKDSKKLNYRVQHPDEWISF